eukprot:15433725-Alexandrium_andersonii.AAC.1
MARGQLPVSSAAVKMPARAWKQRSGWSRTCSEARPSRPGALRRACLNLRRIAAGRSGLCASMGTAAGASVELQDR